MERVKIINRARFLKVNPGSTSFPQSSEYKVNAGSYIRLLRTVLRLTESEFGFIGSFVDTGKEKLCNVKFVGAKSLGVRIHESEEMHTLSSHLCTALQFNKPFIANNPSKNPFTFPGIDDPRDLKNYAILPIYANYRLTALVGVANRLEKYDVSTIIKLIQPAIESVGNLIQTNHSIFDVVSEQDLFKSFIKYTPLAVAMFDCNFRYLTVSDVWLRLYDLQDKNLIGHVVGQPTGNFISKRIFDRLKAVLQGKIIKSKEDAIVRPDGSSLWLKSEAHPWHNEGGEIGGLIIFCEDITERKTAEIKMKRMLFDLSRSNQELERFAYGCCHDMNEPLRGMASMAHLVMKHNADVLDETSQKYLEHIIKGASRLQHLIQDILVYSKVGAEGLLHENVFIQEVVKEIKDIHSIQLLENKAVIEEGFFPDCVWGNRDQIGQVFQNLIENAIKFQSSKNPKIFITSEVYDENFWHFSIKDNGIGIEEEYFEDVFVVFKRLHGRQNYQGSGIGLSLCQKIIEVHGGKIWITSNPDGGSTIHFTLPASPFARS